MRHGRHGLGDVVEVELLEDGDAAPPWHEVPPDEQPDVEDPARTRRRRVVRLAAVVVAVALVGGATLVQNLVAAAERARFADVAGIAPDLSEPLAEAWRVADAQPVAHHDGVLVLSGSVASRTRGVDAATGELVWERHDRAAWEVCLPLEGWRRSTVADSPMLVCLGSSLAPGSVPDDAGAEPEYRITTVGTVDGVEGTSSALPGHLVGADFWQGDLVAAAATRDGAIDVLRWDPVSAEEVWHITRPPGTVSSPGEVVGYVTGGTFAVERYLEGDQDEEESAPTRLLSVDMADGTELPPDAGRDSWSQVVELDDGRTAVTRIASGGEPQVEVLEADGRLAFERTGWLWEPGVDDGSGPDVLLLQDGARLVAVDEHDGTERWSDPAGAAGGLLARLDGVLVVSGPSTVGIDLEDGDLLWSVPGGSATTAGVSDGRVILVEHRSADGRSLMALDLHGGAELWRVPFGQDDFLLGAAGGVLVQSGADLVVLR